MLTQPSISVPAKRFKNTARAARAANGHDAAPPAAVLPPAPPPPAPARIPVSSVIYQALVDLHNSNRIASRQVLVDITGLTYSVVDDHVKRMIDDGRVRRVVNGIFEPVPDAPEDRAVSVTHLPGGGVKLEIGDTCIDLTLRETRMVGMATAGVALQFGR
ncbi:hypothetical protein C7T35_01350 [Variovorax sp. WS11]|uniref:hypothetical protein n=1 Tax=Variovorax sp. WS11 TaxID=1105204 RepID=UPI000D0CD182|nr:hypothetical protein [Variovorax sp. WS11]NDZ11501.1 hypothetical protein [Variovorax sp. WS11]PSL86643.1 hypothetical protein C7T35_01350 [Variovorax sp. WS11]